MRIDNRFTADEESWALTSLDPILPSQYLDTLRSRARSSPEMKLMFAVLNDAICCVMELRNAKDRKKKKQFNEAVAWMKNENEDWIFSFENICDVMGLGANYLRSGLLNEDRRQFLKARSNKRRRTPGIAA